MIELYELVATCRLRRYGAAAGFPWPPESSKIISSRTVWPTRPSILAISTSRIASRRFGPVPPTSEWSAYIGWKQPDSRPASSSAAAAAAQRMRSGDNIDDPLWHHNYPLGRTAFKRAANGLQRQHGGPDLLLRGSARDRDVGALAAVDLNGQRDRVLDQEVALERGPAFFGKVRHHRSC